MGVLVRQQLALLDCLVPVFEIARRRSVLARLVVLQAFITLFIALPQHQIVVTEVPRGEQQVGLVDECAMCGYLLGRGRQSGLVIAEQVQRHRARGTWRIEFDALEMRAGHYRRVDEMLERQCSEDAPSIRVGSGQLASWITQSGCSAPPDGKPQPGLNGNSRGVVPGRIKQRALPLDVDDGARRRDVVAAAFQRIEMLEVEIELRRAGRNVQVVLQRIDRIALPGKPLLAGLYHQPREPVRLADRPVVAGQPARKQQSKWAGRNRNRLMDDEDAMVDISRVD